MSETNLVDRIAQFMERFVFLKDRQLYRFLALWVIQTYLHKQFEYMGYVFAHSPEPGSGKSRLLEVLDSIAANSTGPVINPTESILFRTADGKTQLLDEVDSWTNREFLRGVLNAGFHRGGIVLRNERGQNDKWDPVQFPVYGPRALAGIGLSILHGTTLDRTFVIQMVKQMPTERREKFRLRKVKPEADCLKLEVEAWVKQNGSRVIALYDSGESAFPYLRHLRDRTIDIVEPLSAILEVAYGGTPELSGRRMELLEAVSLSRNDGEEFVGDHRILRELLRLASAEDPLVGNASELAAKCEVSPAPTEYAMAATLRRYGFGSRSVRKGESVRHRYVLGRTALAEVCQRFACEPPQTVSGDSQPTNPKASGDAAALGGGFL